KASRRPNHSDEQYARGGFFMAYRIRKVGILQFAYVTTIVYAIGGLIYGIFWWLVIAPIMLSEAARHIAAGGMLAGMGAFAIVFGLAAGAVLGFIVGLLYSLLYNGAARITGGIELTLDPVATTTSV